MWKEKVGIKKKVHMLGHSMGGYQAIVYALTYPEEVETLILLSPAGIPEKPEGFSALDLATAGKSRMEKSLIKFANFVWSARISPQTILRVTGKYIGDKIYRATNANL
mmetsp:Transcript_7581/g.6927  ORF Transcript_7581/g.6927 Transcript_7581/m.6927 type:complete len:108 (+) Transcript_7581:462-785(+)|eukprot:CAMPEP_0170540998 /NCGR_PEP_ID=MMETSP0211-20121228/862_1 /TAXON_ID=311385 /ORGANISM="Pseudokeronopsis sp., Strain OXSARD2" /LENGTH=107 /DNA_ID=CAMNT_0010843575 /DNA_START=441 /DNA_END=764 /DNA_ORIENTATION=+